MQLLPKRPDTLLTRAVLAATMMIASPGCDQKRPPADEFDPAAVGLEPSGRDGPNRALDASMPAADGSATKDDGCGAVDAAVRASAEQRRSVLFNEVFAGSLFTEREDWIELHNIGDAPVALDGWRIEDHYTGDVAKDAPGRFEFSKGTTICPDEFLVVSRDEHCDVEPLSFAFGVGTTDRLVLSDSQGEVIDDVAWRDLPAGQSMGRPRDDSGAFQRLTIATRKRPNADVCECCGECLVGKCTLRDGACVVETDADCVSSLACTQLGWCALRDGRCQAATSAHCQNSLLCRAKGMCVARDGACVLGTDADCRAAKVCENEGRCSADPVRGECTATSAADCAASDDCVHTQGDQVLSRKNRCTLEGARCVAVSCEESSVCQERMCCSLVAGKCVAP